MNRELQEKIRKTKALQGKSVEDVVRSERFFRVLATYMREQKETREAADLLAKSRNLTLNTHPMTEMDMEDVDGFREEYLKCLSKTSELRPMMRKYIMQLAGQAYAYTVALIICEQFPELKSQLLNTKKQ